MRTLNIAISDLEYTKFGLKDEFFNFTDFLDLVSKELTRQHLNECLTLAEKHGLSDLTMAEITTEVQAARSRAKGRA